MPLTELPKRVKSILPASLSEAWLRAFNMALDEGHSDCYARAWAVALNEAFPGNDKVVLNLNDSDYTFAIDLTGIKFDENDETVTWLQAMPLGKFQHPMHGLIDVTPEKIQELADNANAGVRGQDLDIDYDHKAKTTEAAGWIKGAQARSDGLWVGVKWTQSALAKLKEGAYRYFSPEFTDQWTNPATQKTHKNVLFGGALTNRPFLKGILPINLSEVIPNESGERMLEELRKLLGLPDTATEAEILAAAQTKMGDGETPPAGTEPAPGTEPTAEPEPEPAPAPEAVAASEQIKRMSEEIDLLKAANRLSAVTVKLSEVNVAKPGRKFALTPAGAETLKALALDAPNETYSDRLFQFAEEVLSKGIVELGERGKGHTTSENGTSATIRFSEAVAKHAADNKVDYATAASVVAASEPELYDEYRNEAYVRTRGEEG